MQTIATQIHVGVDRRLKIDLPDSVPIGEYEVLLVLNQRSAELPEVPVETDSLMPRWEKWFGEVDRLTLPDDPEAGDFPQQLLDKYRQQGLELRFCAIRGYCFA